MTDATAIKETTELSKHSVRDIMKSEYVAKRFREILGKKAPGFIASVLSVAANNELLAKADSGSVLNAALIAATLDLPINQNLGFAYIIPYNDRKKGVVAQFQMGYKGFIQLAQRSGQFKTLNVTKVCEGEIKTNNLLTGEMEYAWKEGDRDKLPAVGYVAYMKLTNGFEKSLYMTVRQLKDHGMRYSASAKKGYGLWTDDFDAMASKTVIKLLLSKYAPLTTQMQTATLADQAIVKGDDEFEYIDNKKEAPEEVADGKERERIKKHITEAKTVEDLERCREFINPDDEELTAAFTEKKTKLEGGK